VPLAAPIYRTVASTKLHKHPSSDNTDRRRGGYIVIGATGARYYGTLSRILQVNFREFTFHALR